MIKNHNLPPRLAEEKDKIAEHARKYGLDFYETIFQLIDYKEMASVAAYTGFPNRYPHWKFGMEYNRQRQSDRLGLGRIYEMVINNNPSYAYLMDTNDLVQQKMVMAHVYGHVDFFKNNYMFKNTNRKMMDKMANNATKIRQYEDKYGINEVEGFIDLVLSLENLIDFNSTFRAKENKKYEKQGPAKLEVKREYMDSYVNPKVELEKRETESLEGRMKKLKLVVQPELDILNFLIKHAPLPQWQRSIIDIIREESYYFTPQGRTKILNEGWASYWHAKIMTEKVLDTSEIVDFADCHSKVASMPPNGQLNPYALGLALLRDIEDRWNKGRHGSEYERCDDMKKRREWNTHENKGLEKIFHIRENYNDITFIDEFFTQDFVNSQKLFSVGKDENEKEIVWFIESKKVADIKNQLLAQLTNMGSPIIYVTSGNYQNKGELLLHHKWTGQQLDKAYAYRTLANLEQIWSRPVNLESYDEENIEWKRLRCDNGKILEADLQEKDLTYKY